MANIADLTVKVGADIADALSGLSRVESAVGKLGGLAGGAAMALGGAFVAGGAALAGFSALAVKTGSEFEAKVSAMGAVSSATTEQLGNMRQVALDLGQATSKSASQVADGMTELAKRGMEIADIVTAMPGIISAAEASGESMATTTEVVGAALTNFGLKGEEATRVADILALASNKSAAGMTDLGYTFKYAAPFAKTLGIDIETLSAATMIMADAGIKGEMAGTALRMSLIRLAAPPKAAANELKNLKIQTRDAAGNMIPFDGIIAQLSESLKGMGSAQKIAALSNIFGAEAAGAMIKVIEAGPDKLREYTRALQDSGGTSDRVAKQMKDNLAGDFEQMTGAWETLQITFAKGAEPLARAGTQALTGFITGLTGALPGAIRIAEDSFNTIKQVFAGTWVSAEGIHPVTRFVGEIAQHVKDALPTIQSFGQALGKMFTGDMSGGLAQIGTIIAPAIKRIQDTFKDLAPTGERIGGMFDAIGKALSPVAGYLTTGNGAVDTAKTAWKGFADVVNAGSGGIAAGAKAIGEFGNGFRDMAGKLGTVDTLAASLKRMAESAERFGKTGTAIGEAFGKFNDGMEKASGKTIPTIFGEAFATHVDTNIVKPINAATLAIEGFSKLLQGQGPIIDDAAPALEGGPLSLFGTMGGRDVEAAAATQAAALQTVLAPAYDFASERAAAFGQGQALIGPVMDATATSTAMIGPVLDTAADAQSNLAATSADTAVAVADAGAATADAAAGTAEAIKTSAADAEAAQQGILSVLDGMKGQVVAKIGEMGSEGGAKFDALWNAGLAAATGMSQDVTAQATAMSENVISAVDGMVSGATTSANGLAGAISSAVSAAVAVAQGAAGSFQAAGVAMGQGLVAGIQSQTGAVAAAAGALAAAAANAARVALQVSSPSKVMGDIGKEGGAGLAQGFDESTPESVNAVTKHVKAVKDAATKELEDMVRAVKDQLAEMTRAWDDAFRKAKDFASGMLTGEKAASDALFENEQEALAIQKKINDLKLAGAGQTKLSQDGKRQIAANQALDDALKMEEQKLSTLRLQADQIRINERLQNDRSRRELKALVDFNEEMDFATRAALVLEQLDIMGATAPQIEALQDQLNRLERKGPSAFVAIAESASEAAEEIGKAGKAMAGLSDSASPFGLGDTASGKSGGSAGDFGAIGPPIYPYIYPFDQGELFGGAGLGDFGSVPSVGSLAPEDSGGGGATTVEAETVSVTSTGPVKLESTMQQVQIVLNLPGGSQIVAMVLAEPPAVAALADGFNQYNQLTGARGG